MKPDDEGTAGVTGDESTADASTEGAQGDSAADVASGVDADADPDTTSGRSGVAVSLSPSCS